MLLLFFYYRDCFSYFIESLVLPAIETQYRGFLEQSKLLTIVVVDVKFLLDFFHLLKVSGEIGILGRFKQLSQFLRITFLLLSSFAMTFRLEVNIGTAWFK
jgi:hypothetical protein